MFRDPQSLERRHRALSAASRFQGAGDHEFRLRSREVCRRRRASGRVLAHLREIVEATDVPVNADFESGFADDPDGVAESVRLCVATGVAGLSIEDSTGDETTALRFRLCGGARARGARRDRQGWRRRRVHRPHRRFPARPARSRRDYPPAQGLLPMPAPTASILPASSTPEHIAATVKAVAPKPVNLLMSGAPALTVSDIAALGVRRISVGGTLARVAWDAFMRAARAIAERRQFDSFAGWWPARRAQRLVRRRLRSDDAAMTVESERAS